MIPSFFLGSSFCAAHLGKTLLCAGVNAEYWPEWWEFCCSWTFLSYRCPISQGFNKVHHLALHCKLTTKISNFSVFRQLTGEKCGSFPSQVPVLIGKESTENPQTALMSLIRAHACMWIFQWRWWSCGQTALSCIWRSRKWSQQYHLRILLARQQKPRMHQTT